MKKFWLSLTDILRPFAAGLLIVALLAGLLGFRLGGLHQGISSEEAGIVQQIQSRGLSAQNIVMDNALYLPYQIGLYAIEKLGFTELNYIRGVGAFFGMIGALAFYLILRKWHTRRIAVLGTSLLISSSWFLHSTRLATPEATYLLLPVLLYIGIKLVEGNRPFVFLSLGVLTTVTLLYIPGLQWFIVPALIWQRRRILATAGEVNHLWGGVLIVLAVILLLPLGYTLATNQGLWQEWLGYKVHGLTLIGFLKAVAHVPLHIFIQSEADPIRHVGRLPLLDVATTIFTALGVYWYVFRRRLDRAKLLLVSLILGSILVAIGGHQYMALILPFIYLIAAAGLTLMLQRWFTVFPRNPLARSIGVGLIAAVVLLASYYHLRRYFIVWPNTPATKQVYSIQV